MDLNELLGIDLDDPTQALAERLVADHRGLLDELFHLRRQQGLSQADVAEAMGVTTTAISKIETGDRDLRLSTIRRYALAIDAEINTKVSKSRSTRKPRFEVSDPHVLVVVDQVATKDETSPLKRGRTRRVKSRSISTKNWSIHGLGEDASV